MDMNKVLKDDLVRAGLDLMRQGGKPLERAPSKGTAMIYRTPDGKTVRLRTCNDHILIVVGDSPDEDAKLNIEDTDLLLVVMPERPRTNGPAVAYLIPTEVAVAEARRTHSDWLATNPNTKGKNNTWNLWFDDDNPKAGGYARTWAKYKLPGSASTVPPEPPSMPAGDGAKPRQVMDDCRIKIAEAFGVRPDAVKISIDFSA